MTQLHPDSSFLAEYSSGSLSPAMSVSVSAHLHYCSTCRDHIDSLEEIGGVLLENGEAVQLQSDCLDSVMAKLDAPVEVVQKRVPVPSKELQKLPRLVQNLIPGQAEWHSLSPSLKIARIPIGETRYELALHKIKPGGSAPEHDHRGLEVTVVLQGSFSDDDGVYREGDFIVREPGDVHTPIATQNEQCICLSVCEAPIRMVGPFKRLLNPFISFRPA